MADQSERRGSDDTSSDELRQLAFVAENYVDRDAFTRAAKALDARDAEIARYKEASKSALCVLCALRDTADMHPNMLKDVEMSIDALRTALQGGDDEG